MPYRNNADGTKDNRPFNLYAYVLPLKPTKTVSSVALAEPRVRGLAMTLLPSHSTTPDVALSASPSSLSITPESTARSTITGTPLSCFHRNMHLTISDEPQ